MELRKDELKESPEPRKEECRSRFQILKLEERIAPHGGHRKECLASGGVWRRGHCAYA